MRGDTFRRAALMAAAIVGFVCYAAAAETAAGESGRTLRVGWAQVDITPAEPVLLAGQMYARVSEGVMDPVTATALALESVREGRPVSLILVSCDLIAIHDELRDAVRAHLRQALPALDPQAVLLNATHTHSAPLAATHPRYRPEPQQPVDLYGVPVDAMDPADYVAFAAERIAGAIVDAWTRRAPGGIAFGLGHAVVGRNRLTSYADGTSRMYGAVNDPDFSHMEGYEDASLHLLSTYDAEGRLTGVVLNLACPAQVSANSREISADFWHETREELRRRQAPGLFVLPQIGASGDLSPNLLGNEGNRPQRTAGRENAEARMWRLAGRSQREEIAVRIADAVAKLLPLIEQERDWNPVFAHRVETVALPRRIVPEQDAVEAGAEAAAQRLVYEGLQRELAVNPALGGDRAWLRKASGAYRAMRRNEGVVERFELQKSHPAVPVELHVARFGDVAFASNPFELYLDYGLQISSRSRAVQTFVVQLAGSGTYLPTTRAVAGGAYGAVPASTEVGPDSGALLVEWTLRQISELWQD